jgi:hypothetical protein
VAEAQIAKPLVNEQSNLPPERLLSNYIEMIFSTEFLSATPAYICGRNVHRPKFRKYLKGSFEDDYLLSIDVGFLLSADPR